MWYSNPEVKAICGLKLLLVLTFTPRDYGRFFFSLLKHHDFQIHREWQTMEILESKAGVKGRTLHVTNKNANERGQEIFLIVIKFVTCEVRWEMIWWTCHEQSTKKKPESPGGIEPKTFRTPVGYSNQWHKSFIYDMHPANCYDKQCWNRQVCDK